MFKQLMIGLFAMTVIALLWAEANAGKVCAGSGGSRVCWTTGSEICQLTTKKLQNFQGATVECSVFGTLGDGCDTTLNPSCDIDGIIFRQSDTTPNGNPFDYPNALSNSDTLFADTNDGDDFRFDESTDVAAQQSGAPCNQKGKCKLSIEIEPNPSDTPQFDDVITFTALVFNAQTRICPFGDCDSPDVIEIVARCTVEPPVRADKKKNYECVEFSPDPG